MSDDPPKKSNELVTPVLVSLLLVGAILLGWQEVSDSHRLPEGAAGPDFTLPRLSGEPVTLSALRGQVVVLDFWATWCPPCREEMPYLVRTAQAYAAQGVTLLAISNDDADGQREVVTSFTRAFPELGPYAVLGRPRVAQDYLVRALPTLYVLDREGRVVTSRQGQVTEGQLRDAIEAALERR